MDPILEQSIRQKKIAFSTSEHVEAVITILKEVSSNQKLVGDTEFETVKNAITLDAQAQLIMNFINAVDRIKGGSLVTTESNG